MNGSRSSSGTPDCQDQATVGQVGRAAVLDAVTTAMNDQPVGLILIEMLIEFDDPGPADATDDLSDTLRDRINRGLRANDTVIAAGLDRVAIIKPALTEPAETEGFALRLLNALGGPMVSAGRRASCHSAIGVAVSLSGDHPADLIRYAEHALGDARMLGGDMVVFFEDADRELLLDTEPVFDSESVFESESVFDSESVLDTDRLDL